MTGTSGQPIGRVALDRAWTVLDADPSFVVVRRDDDLELQEVHVYRLRR